MKKVTVWRRLAAHDNTWPVNHIEDGWKQGDRPRSPDQTFDKYWNEATWKKELIFADEAGQLIYPNKMASVQEKKRYD